ncbi:Transposase [Nitrosospira multiformis]|nr:Transposase [Nitrosospira multiformis]
MKKQNKFSPEVRERAVRLVQEHRGEYPSLWATIESIAPKIGCVPQTLNEWVRKHEVDNGVRDGVTSAERERVKELERENRELRKANEILKLASAFFAHAELRIRFFNSRTSAQRLPHRRYAPPLVLPQP